MLGVRGLMGEDGRGQLGGLDLGGEGRRELARRSRGWVCGVCGVSNEEIVAEMRRRVEKGKGKVLAEEGEEEGLVVPEEMRFVSRQELDEKAGQVAGSPEAVEATVRTGDAAPQTSRLQPRASPATTAALAVQEQLPPWIDKAIVWSAVALVTLILKRLLFG